MTACTPSSLVWLKRASPFSWIITTAGVNPDGPCESSSKNAPNKCSTATWPKRPVTGLHIRPRPRRRLDRRAQLGQSKPSLGVTVYLGALRSEYEKAVAEGIAKENNFKAKT